MQISRSVKAVGGVVLAAAVIGFTNPKSVHALTAALVQVTNTASNPVVSSEVSLAPAELVELVCYKVGVACIQVPPGGRVNSTAAYVVPEGKTLVITEVDVNSSTISSYTAEFGIQYLTGCTSCNLLVEPLTYQVAQDGLTHHFSLTHGIAWPSGATLIQSGNPSLSGYLYGYIANN